MGDWIIYWMDGSTYRQTVVPSIDIHNLLNCASSFGVYNIYGIIKIERVAK